MVVFAGLIMLSHPFRFSVFYQWGLVPALFGTILPPILFNKGLPKTGIGLASILISVEIPISVGFAHLLLGETVLATQWAGIILILLSVLLLNVRTVYQELRVVSG